jgi:excisionase family DNA binding protein
MQELMTVDEVAEFLKIKPEIVRRKIRSNTLKAYKIGKAYRISKEQLDSFLKNSLSS